MGDGGVRDWWGLVEVCGIHRGRAVWSTPGVHEVQQATGTEEGAPGQWA